VSDRFVGSKGDGGYHGFLGSLGEVSVTMQSIEAAGTWKRLAGHFFPIFSGKSENLRSVEERTVQGVSGSDDSRNVRK
jgi:hypothetical protein